MADILQNIEKCKVPLKTYKSCHVLERVVNSGYDGTSFECFPMKNEKKTLTISYLINQVSILQIY